jgi:hypothetical protein
MIVRDVQSYEVVSLAMCTARRLLWETVRKDLHAEPRFCAEIRPGLRAGSCSDHPHPGDHQACIQGNCLYLASESIAGWSIKTKSECFLIGNPFPLLQGRGGYMSLFIFRASA